MKKQQKSSAVAHACNPSTLGGQGRWITRSRDRDHSGQCGETLSLLKIQKLAGRSLTVSPRLECSGAISVLPSNPLASPKLAMTIFPRPFPAERVIPKLSTRRGRSEKPVPWKVRGRRQALSRLTRSVTLGDLPASASQSAGITGVSNRTQPTTLPFVQ
ncbi:Olfactory receptor 1F12 [Plecturocebus cupreus]